MSILPDSRISLTRLVFPFSEAVRRAESTAKENIKLKRKTVFLFKFHHFSQIFINLKNCFASSSSSLENYHDRSIIWKTAVWMNLECLFGKSDQKQFWLACSSLILHLPCTVYSHQSAQKLHKPDRSARLTNFDNLSRIPPMLSSWFACKLLSNKVHQRCGEPSFSKIPIRYLTWIILKRRPSLQKVNQPFSTNSIMSRLRQMIIF